MYRIKHYHRCCNKNIPRYGLNVSTEDGQVNVEVWCKVHAPAEVVEQATQMELKRKSMAAHPVSEPADYPEASFTDEPLGVEDDG